MTRKILVPIDIENPEKIIKDFLYPKKTNNGFVLTGIKTNKESEFGMVILTIEINEFDIYKKIVESGVQISSEVNLIASLKDYVYEMPKYKIGNILEINNSNDKLELKMKYQRLTKKK